MDFPQTKKDLRLRLTSHNPKFKPRLQILHPISPLTHISSPSPHPSPSSNSPATQTPSQYSPQAIVQSARVRIVDVGWCKYRVCAGIAYIGIPLKHNPNHWGDNCGSGSEYNVQPPWWVGCEEVDVHAEKTLDERVSWWIRGRWKWVWVAYGYEEKGKEYELLRRC